MGLLNNNAVTLLDLAKRLGPDNKIGLIIEALAQLNPVVADIPFMEGNELTGERTTIRTGLPEVYFRLLNQGVPPSKSTTAQIMETAAIMEAWSKPDKAVADLSGDVNKFRMSEAVAFLEAMSQKMAYTLFYGNSAVNKEEFTGLAARYSALTGAGNSENVIDGGGAGSDNTSVYFLGLGEHTIRGLYPKGMTAGLQHNNLGEDNDKDASGRMMRVYVDQFIWNCGLAVKDWRYGIRIANIDISALVDDSAAADLDMLLKKAYHRIPNAQSQAVKWVVCMNRTVFQYLDIQRDEKVKAGGGITWENVDGKPIPFYRGIPIRITDALHNAEEAVA